MKVKMLVNTYHTIIIRAYQFLWYDYDLSTFMINDRDIYFCKKESHYYKVYLRWSSSFVVVSKKSFLNIITNVESHFWFAIKHLMEKINVYRQYITKFTACEFINTSLQHHLLTFVFGDFHWCSLMWNSMARKRWV